METQRPTGETILTIAAFAAISTIVGVLLTITATPENWLMTALATGALFELSLFMWLVGMVVRALWFLPGREIADAAPTDIETY